MALRFLTRAVAKMGFGADDWWALTAFFSFMAEQGIELYGVSTALAVKTGCLTGFAALNDGLHAKSPILLSLAFAKCVIQVHQTFPGD